MARKPVIVMPNAGGPREVGGRMLYLNSPEYFTEFCKRYIEMGARGDRATIPIIAGLYPLVSFKNAQFMSRHVPGVVVPDGVLERMSRCSADKEAAATEGVAMAREIRDRVADTVAGFQTSAPLGRMDIALAVLA